MQNKQMIIGITGGIGSGKSAVSSILKNLGYPVVDADEISRAILNIGTKAYERTVAYFGQSILLDNGKVNRTLLGEMIFNDKTKREALNQIVHPAVYEAMKAKIDTLKTVNELIFVDVPLLYESGRDSDYDEVWVVNAREAIRLQRICKRDDVNEAYARVKINAQMPLDEKVKRATRVIDNNDSLEHLERRVKALLIEIKK